MMEASVATKAPAAKPATDIGSIAWGWWNALNPRTTEDGGRIKGDRAALARLRRSNLEAAAVEPATIVLFESLKKKSIEDLGRVAALAGVLACVRENTKGPVARAIGPNAEGDALVSPLRMRRLLAAKGDDAILTAFRRLVAQMDGKASVGDLARNILLWDQEETGDKQRMRFAFDYYRTGSVDAAPALTPATE
jgi:CRISPR system Cascade subunit CasB